MKPLSVIIPLFLLIASIGFSIGTDYVVPSSNPLGPPLEEEFAAGSSNVGQQEEAILPDTASTEETTALACLEQ